MRRASAASLLPDVVMPRRLTQVKSGRAAALVDRVRTVRRMRRVPVRSAAVARIRREAVVTCNNRTVVGSAERRLMMPVFLRCDGQAAFEDGSVSARRRRSEIGRR